jgi:phage gp29-like protein
MGSKGKKKTTMAKLARESRLRERRVHKQAKKDARKRAPSDSSGWPTDSLNAMGAEAAQPDLGEAALEPVVQPLAEASDRSGEAPR